MEDPRIEEEKERIRRALLRLGENHEADILRKLEEVRKVLERL